MGERESKIVEMEQIMASGLLFLAGPFKMSTGKELGLENRQIKINKETGEVTMTFKLPVLDFRLNSFLMTFITTII